MATYDALAQLQDSDPRLRIHSISTATDVNMDEIRRLTAYLFERCPRMDHHNLAMIRGDRKNPSLQGPSLAEYQRLYDYVRACGPTREEGRYGSVVGADAAMGQVAHRRPAASRWSRAAPECSTRWCIPMATSACAKRTLRSGISARRRSGKSGARPRPRPCANPLPRKECYCTNEVFLWPSITYQPAQLARAMIGAKVWQGVAPLPRRENAGGAPDGGAVLPAADGLVEHPAIERKGVMQPSRVATADRSRDRRKRRCIAARRPSRAVWRSTFCFSRLANRTAKLLTFASFSFLSRMLGPHQLRLPGIHPRGDGVLHRCPWIWASVRMARAKSRATRIGARPACCMKSRACGWCWRSARWRLLAVFILALRKPFELKLLLSIYGVSLLGGPFLLQWFFQAHDQMQWVGAASIVRQGGFARAGLPDVPAGRSAALFGLVECGSVLAVSGFCIWVTHCKMGFPWPWPDLRIGVAGEPL